MKTGLMLAFEAMKRTLTFTENIQKNQLNDEIASRDDAWDTNTFFGLLPDPDPVLMKMSGGAEILESLMADDHLTSVIQTRKIGTLKKEWKLEPGSLNNKEPDNASLRLHENFAADLENLDMSDIISQIIDAPYFGNIPIEILYAPGQSLLRGNSPSEPNNGLWRIDDLKPLPSRWFAFGENNQPRFLSKDNPFAGEELPSGKFVFATHFPTYDNPYGLRLLSRCFWPISFKRGGVKFWVKFLEKYGMPWAVGKYKSGSSADVKYELLSKLSSMVQDAVAVIPDNSSVDIIASKGGSGAGHEKLITKMDSAVSKVIMGQTLTAEMGSTGSYAASQTHESILNDYQTADQKLVKKVIENIGWWYGQINDTAAIAPKFIWHEEDDPKTGFSERDKNLKETGVKFTKIYFARKYNLKDDEFEITEDEENQEQEPADHSESRKFTAEQQALEDLTDGLIKDAATASGKLIVQIKKAVDESNDYDELFERLAALLPDLDGEQIGELLERGIFNAEMFGVSTAHREEKED